MKRIGLNLLFLVPGETGGSEIYARGLLPALIEARPELDYTVFVNRELGATIKDESWHSDVKVVPIPVRGSSRFARVLAEQTLLPVSVRKHRIDVLHSLATTSPMVVPAASVVTILDVIYHHHPEAHAKMMALGMRALVPLSAKRADRVIAISNGARDDLIETLGLNPEKVDVIYLGAESIGKTKPTPEDQLRDRLGLGASTIVLSLGAKRPHKNLQRLIKAFARLDNGKDSVLALAGPTGPHEEELRKTIAQLGVSNRVKLLGWLDSADIESLYSMARCFVFPSLKEGFGLPLVEAMQRGVPVACSSAAPLPEIAGDAVRYFDPLSVDDMTMAITELLTDRREREHLATAGIKWASRYRWERAAQETLSVYERTHLEYESR